MNAENVKTLLENVYGQGQRTLTIEGKSKASKATYYYSLPDIAEILAIRDALEPVMSRDDAKADDLVYKYPVFSNNKNRSNQCAVFTQHGPVLSGSNYSHWDVSFFEIVGIRFHRSFGRHIAATLMLGRKPLTSLYSAHYDFLYGFWSEAHSAGSDAHSQTSRGMNYWVNKNLFFNERFRAFSVAFLEAVAVERREYILKDVARAIQKNGFFLPDIPYSDLRQCRTPKDFILPIFPNINELGININALDANTAYITASLARITARIDWKYLKNLPDEIVRNAFSLNALFDGLTPELAVAAYYQSALGKDYWQYEADTIAKDYAKLCIDNGVEVRLGYSLNQLENAHDELSVLDRERALEPEFNTPLIATPSQFDALEPKLEAAFPGEFERMKDARRLHQEGEDQHNCVFSRRFLLRCDSAAVFHWNHEGVSYTVQFGNDRNGFPYVEEIRARYNEPCHPAVLSLLNDKLNLH